MDNSAQKEPKKKKIAKFIIFYQSPYNWKNFAFLRPKSRDFFSENWRNNLLKMVLKLSKLMSSFQKWPIYPKNSFEIKKCGFTKARKKSVPTYTKYVAPHGITCVLAVVFSLHSSTLNWCLTLWRYFFSLKNF